MIISEGRDDFFELLISPSLDILLLPVVVASVPDTSLSSQFSFFLGLYLLRDLLGGLHDFHLGLLLLLVSAEFRSSFSRLKSDLFEFFSLFGFVSFIFSRLFVITVFALHGGNHCHNLFKNHVRDSSSEGLLDSHAPIAFSFVGDFNL